MTNFHLPVDGSILVVDDNPDEALPLIRLLSSRGIACTYYSGIDDDELPNTPSQKIRLAFFDIQLYGGSSAHNYAQTILRLQERLIPEDNGPFILVLWSSRLDDLADVVEEQVLSIASKRKPLCILRLEKSDLFETDFDDSQLKALMDDIDTKLAVSFKNEDLEQIKKVINEGIISPARKKIKNGAIEKITEALNQGLQKKADSFQLFTEWESMVCQAAGKTVRSYCDLHKDREHWAENIKYIIYRMAYAQAGQNLDKLDENEFIKNALKTLTHTFLDDLGNKINNSANIASQINLDRNNLSFTNSLKGSAYKLKWLPTKGYSFYKENTLVPPGSKSEDLEKIRKKVKAHFQSSKDVSSHDAVDDVIDSYLSIKPEINSKLHIDSITTAHIQPGNVYLRNDIDIDRRKKLLETYFSCNDEKCAFSDNQIDEIKFVELEVTPPCDFAQTKWLKLRILPGVLIPEELREGLRKIGSFYQVAPILKFNGLKYKLVFDCRLFKSSDEAAIQALGAPLFRLRHELHADIISHLSSHISRLGITFLE